MGKRSAIETTVGILSAFLRQRTWRQAELARELELEPRALRRHLSELTRRGFRLEKDDERPQVYWSVPKDWFPGGVLLQAEEAQALVQLLCRVPPSTARNKLLKGISSALPGPTNPAAQLESVFHGLGDEAPFLALVGEAAARRSAIHVQYFSANRGALEWRHLSVQRVMPGPPARMVAQCHREGALKWFRVDGIVDAHVDTRVPYQLVPAAAVETYLTNSLDGFSAGDVTIDHRFFVADPDARWVVRNLIAPMKAQVIAGGVRFTCRTAATLRLARYVLSLAPLARAETAELASLVHQLATATLAEHQRAKPLRVDPVSARVAARGARVARRANRAQRR
jgi:predicted DNA-binding transcriptional regulator YafY